MSITNYVPIHYLSWLYVFLSLDVHCAQMLASQGCSMKLCRAVDCVWSTETADNDMSATLVIVGSLEN